MDGFTRRELLTAIAGAATGALFALRSNGVTTNGAERCDGCGDPAPDASALSYCLWCDAVIHRSCADLIACDYTIDSGWREMFHEATPDEIELIAGHELIVAVIEFDFTQYGKGS